MIHNSLKGYHNPNLLFPDIDRHSPSPITHYYIPLPFSVPPKKNMKPQLKEKRSFKIKSKVIKTTKLF